MKALNSNRSRACQKKVIFIILVMDGLAIFVLEMHPLLITAILVWSIAWLSTNLTWQLHWDNNEIKDGYKIPWGSFIVRRGLLFSEVGYVCPNAAGSVILFRKSDFKFPGKKEVVIPHNLEGFEMVLQEVIEKVDPSCVDENIQLLQDRVKGENTVAKNRK